MIIRLTIRKQIPRRKRLAAAFSLPELVIASALAAVGLGGIVYGYIMAAQNAEWAAYHLAAHSLAMQRLEQSRSAKWDLQSTPITDELVGTNFPLIVEVLDIPISKTNVVFATNQTTITTISTTPPLKMVRVDCTWRFMTDRIFTNTVVTYRAPDQ
jgi:Tfp pilus assembly protein PilV